jgi:hypothetical protein
MGLAIARQEIAVEGVERPRGDRLPYALGESYEVAGLWTVASR